jgi:hypothetical protein
VSSIRLTALVAALCATATAQVAILQIQVVEGEGAVHAPGSRSGRPLTVAVTDETGRPVAGAAVSFHLPEDGASGTFANGLRTAVVTTGLSGRASLYGLQVNRVSGRFALRIVASKEQARAGIVSFQYIGEGSGGRRPAAPAPAADSSVPAPRPASAAHGHSKWLIVAAPTLSIGAPTVVVVKP